MGKRGPAPEPSILKYIRGNPSKEKLNESEPTPDLLEDFTPPQFVKDDDFALSKWQYAVPILRRMKVLTEADTESFARYCIIWADWMRAREKCKSLGREITHFEQDPNRTDGKLRIKWSQPAPWAVDEKAKHQALLRLEQEFGLTPSSRSQVTIHANTDEDPVAAFVARRGNSAGA